jgi:predicted ester cyclase
MAKVNAVAAVENFWKEVWQSPQNPDAIDRLVSEDFVITTGGVDIVSRAKFKEWVIGFQSKINDLEFEIVESFQNAEGTRVASRWRVRGKNNGILGTKPDQRDVSFTGTAVFAVRDDGVLLHNWVERSAWELYQALTRPAAL